MDDLQFVRRKSLAHRNKNTMTLPTVKTTCMCGCGRAVTATINNRTRTLHKDCRRRKHIAASVAYNQRFKRGGKRENAGRKPQFGGDYIAPVNCKACGHRLIDCRCMDRLDAIERRDALRRIGL